MQNKVMRLISENHRLINVSGNRKILNLPFRPSTKGPHASTSKYIPSLIQRFKWGRFNLNLLYIDVFFRSFKFKQVLGQKPQIHTYFTSKFSILMQQHPNHRTLFMESSVVFLRDHCQYLARPGGHP